MEKHMLNEKNLNLAGWLSVVAAVVTFPVLVMSFVSGMAEEKNSVFTYLEAALDIGYLVLYVYIFVMFRRLLNEKASFHDADPYITFLIWINVAITLVSVATLPFPETADMVGIGSVVLLIPFGIVYVVFGIKLLNCHDDLFGYLKPFSYLTIATGVMVALVVMVLLGMVTSIISDIILALIFFKAAKAVQVQGTLAPGCR
jgi:hypothetical protein